MNAIIENKQVVGLYCPYASAFEREKKGLITPNGRTVIPIDTSLVFVLDSGEQVIGELCRIGENWKISTLTYTYHLCDVVQWATIGDFQTF